MRQLKEHPNQRYYHMLKAERFSELANQRTLFYQHWPGLWRSWRSKITPTKKADAYRHLVVRLAAPRATPSGLRCRHCHEVGTEM